MSGRLQGAAKLVDVPPGALRDVLWVLADWQFEGKQTAHPGMARLVFETGRSEETVRTVLRELERRGWAEVVSPTQQVVTKHGVVERPTGGRGHTPEIHVRWERLPGKPCPMCQEREDHAEGCRRAAWKLYPHLLGGEKKGQPQDPPFEPERVPPELDPLAPETPVNGTVKGPISGHKGSNFEAKGSNASVQNATPSGSTSGRRRGGASHPMPPPSTDSGDGDGDGDSDALVARAMTPEFRVAMFTEWGERVREDQAGVNAIIDCAIQRDSAPRSSTRAVQAFIRNWLRREARFVAKDTPADDQGGSNARGRYDRWGRWHDEPPPPRDTTGMVMCNWCQEYRSPHEPACECPGVVEDRLERARLGPWQNFAFERERRQRERREAEERRVAGEPPPPPHASPEQLSILEQARRDAEERRVTAAAERWVEERAALIDHGVSLVSVAEIGRQRGFEPPPPGGAPPAPPPPRVLEFTAPIHDRDRERFGGTRRRAEPRVPVGVGAST